MEIIYFHSLMCMSGVVLNVGYNNLVMYVKATSAKLRQSYGESLLKAPQEHGHYDKAILLVT